MKNSSGRELRTYEFAAEIRRLGARGVRKAQEESRRLRVPNVYSRGGVIFFERPSGELTRENLLDVPEAS